MPPTYFTHLSCSACGKSFKPEEARTVCPSCGQALLAEYDLAAARKTLRPEMFAGRVRSMWRYRELLPVRDDRHIISLGEGWTPLLPAVRLGAELGIPHLTIKEEGVNPTGSFKARGLSAAVSMAVEAGIRSAAMPSAGNAGGALAAYAARAQMRAHIFMPKDTPILNIREAALYGAQVTLVDGVISDAGKKMRELVAGSPEWFDMSTMKEPYRLEGKKTMGYELAEQFGWKLPDVILYPTGGGTGLIGMWKAFSELEALGWVTGKKPRMVSVQASGCAPIALAFREGKMESAFWEGAATAASGLRVPKAFADRLILRAVAESGGTAIDLPDEEFLPDMERVAALEGILVAPEGAAAVAACRRLRREGFISPADHVVIFNTGSGYKYVELLTGVVSALKT